jgi:hypothetical protein
MSCSLTFLLILLRFVSLYLGTYRLSTYSNLGQMLSKLSVACVLAFSLSLSWHSLWQSGITRDNMLVFASDENSGANNENESSQTTTVTSSSADYSTATTTTTTTKTKDTPLSSAIASESPVLCSKGVDDPKYDLFKFVDLIYFTVNFFLHMCMIVLPFFIVSKLRSKKLYAHAELIMHQQQQHQLLLEQNADLTTKKSSLGTETLRFHSDLLRRNQQEQHQKKREIGHTRHSLPTLPTRSARSTTTHSAGQRDELSNGTVGGGTALSIEPSPGKKKRAYSLDKILNVSFSETKNEEKTFCDNKNNINRRQTYKSFAFSMPESEDRKRNALLYAKLSACQQPKQFSLFVVAISLITGLCCLPYVILDYFYYKDALLVEVLSGFDVARGHFDYMELFLQAPVMLISIMHAIKFYVLFAFYGKFRAQLGRLLQLRLYVDKRLARRLSQKKGRLGSIKFIVTHNFSLVRCCLCCFFDQSSDMTTSNTEHAVNATNRSWLRRMLVRYCLRSVFNTSRRLHVPMNADKARINRMLSKMRNHDYEDETSSIVGFKAKCGVSNTELSMLNLYDPTPVTTAKFEQSSKAAQMKMSLVSPSKSSAQRAVKFPDEERMHEKSSVSSSALMPRNPLIFE